MFDKNSIYQTVFDNINDGYILHKIIYDNDGNACDAKVIAVNKKTLMVMQRDASEVVGKKLSEIQGYVENDLAYWMPLINEKDKAQDGIPLIYDTFLYLDHYYSFEMHFPEKGYYLGISHDVTDLVKKNLSLQESEERSSQLYEELLTSEEELRSNYEKLNSLYKQVEEERNRYKMAEELAHVGNWVYQMDDNSVYLSDEALKIYETDCDRNVFTNATVRQYIHVDDLPFLDEAFDKSTATGESVIYAHRVILDNGVMKYLNGIAKSVFDEDGHVTGAIGTIQDITDITLKNQQLTYLAYHDKLTGLLNREGFLDAVEERMELAKTTSEAFSILTFDLRHFGDINHTLGREIGDRILKTLTENLSQGLGNHFTIGRISGNQFAFISDEHMPSEKIINEYETLITDAVDQINFAGYSFNIDYVSAYVSYPDHGTSGPQLLQHLDVAVSESKTLGQKKPLAFNFMMTSKLFRQHYIKECLMKGLKDQNFQMYYQPQVHLEDTNIISSEALIRLNNIDSEYLSPGEFIPIAEETGIIYELGNWILYNTCEHIAGLSAKLNKPINVSINISAKQLQHPDFYDQLTGVIEQTGIRPNQLELEITETAFLSMGQELIDLLNKVRSLGIRMALDDFGTGYSMLSHLVDLPVDTVKIDLSFVRNVDQDETKKAIVKAILQITQDSKKNVIAEGVETESELKYLLKHGCQYFQGYYYYKPMTLDDLESLMAH